MAEIFSFGAWMRLRRRALDLTREALAQQVGCAASTIKKLENDQRRPSRTLAERLARYLQLSDEERVAFLKAARAGLAADRLPRAPLVPLPLHVAPPAAAAARRSILPLPLTPLVGRRQEIARICTLLSDAAGRLLTLTGPPGIGKTRLALEAARTLQPAFGHNVVFVPLAPIRDPQLVLPTIAQRLDITQTRGQPVIEGLLLTLNGKKLLLVLDNLEQVVEAAPLVAELMKGAPGLKVLVTSRVVLHIRGEYEFQVPPLSLPDPAHLPPPEQLSKYEAVRLFVQRVQAVRPEFALSAENAPTIAAICRRLDGLPLAIELAAVRSKLLSPQLLLERLVQPLDVLTGGPRDLPPHQQTLRDAIAWSHTLLSEAERRLFRRLGVFVGGWTIELAEALCDAEGDLGIAVLDGLAVLLDQSLLQEEAPLDTHVAPRLAMLESIREYALEQLEASGEAAAIRQRHAEVLLALAEQAEPLLIGPEQGRWLDRLEAEHDNLRAALRWAGTSGAGELALRLAGALWQFWYRRGYWSEGYEVLNSVLAAAASLAPSASRAKALNASGMLALGRHHPVRRQVARAHFEESLRIGAWLGDEQAMAWALHGLAAIALEENDSTTARPLFEQSLGHARAAGDRLCRAETHIQLGRIARRAGDSATAQAYCEQSLALCREIGDPGSQAYALNQLGLLAELRADYEAARRLFQQALELRRASVINDRGGIPAVLYNLGFTAYVLNEPEQAMHIFQEGLALAREIGDKYFQGILLFRIGQLLIDRGELEAASAYYKESLAVYEGRDPKHELACCLEGLARLAGLRGQAERAARLLGAVRALRESMGWVFYPHTYQLHEQVLALVGAQLEQQAFAAALAAGRELTLEQALALASEA